MQNRSRQSRYNAPHVFFIKFYEKLGTSLADPVVVQKRDTAQALIHSIRVTLYRVTMAPDLSPHSVKYLH